MKYVRHLEKQKHRAAPKKAKEEAVLTLDFFMEQEPCIFCADMFLQS